MIFVHEPTKPENKPSISLGLSENEEGSTLYN